jgi:mannitol/fructose-specific phosphotransferase system IIA component (Ntr-type)
MLGDFLDRESVAIGAEADGWRAAVECCGELLVAGGTAEERYVPAMVRTVEELGPYAVIAPGVAIPHARPEDGARRVGVSVVVLREPVAFGSKENDPVDLLFGFATTDPDAHVELLGELADFIEKTENLAALRRAGTVEEVLELFERSGA